MISPLTDLITAASGFAALGTMTVASLSARKHFKAERAQAQRIEDAIMGVAATASLPAIPSIFTVVTDLTKSVDEIKDLTRQLRPNGGSSLADEIRRSAHKLDAVKDQLEEQRSQLVAHLEAHVNGETLTTTSTTRSISSRSRRSTPKILTQPTEKDEK